jgi:hypothetical protein
LDVIVGLGVVRELEEKGFEEGSTVCSNVVEARIEISDKHVSISESNSNQISESFSGLDIIGLIESVWLLGFGSILIVISGKGIERS